MGYDPLRERVDHNAFLEVHVYTFYTGIYIAFITDVCASSKAICTVKTTCRALLTQKFTYPVNLTELEFVELQGSCVIIKSHLFTQAFA